MNLVRAVNARPFDVDARTSWAFLIKMLDRRRAFTPIALGLILTVAPSGWLGGQERQLGVVEFQVQTGDGEPLPGVQVILRGPDVDQTAYTGLSGTVRIPGLPPGTGYTATFILRSFPTVVREGIEIKANDTARIVATLGRPLREYLSFGMGQAYCGWRLEEIGREEIVRHRVVPGNGCVLFVGVAFDKPDFIDEEFVVYNWLDVPTLPAAGERTNAHRAYFSVGIWTRPELLVSESHESAAITAVSETEESITATVNLTINGKEIIEVAAFRKAEPYEFLKRCLMSHICG